MNKLSYKRKSRLLEKLAFRNVQQYKVGKNILNRFHDARTHADLTKTTRLAREAADKDPTLRKELLKRLDPDKAGSKHMGGVWEHWTERSPLWKLMGKPGPPK